MQAQQMLDGVQHKVESEIRKGMDCLAQAKTELEVSFCSHQTQQAAYTNITQSYWVPA